MLGYLQINILQHLFTFNFSSSYFRENVGSKYQNYILGIC
jgi:hypothetical protein